MTELEEYRALQLYRDISLLMQGRMTTWNRRRINERKRELEQILEGEERHDSNNQDREHRQL